MLNRAIKPLYKEQYVGGRQCLRYNFIDLDTNELISLSDVILHEVFIVFRGKKITVKDVQWNYVDKVISVHFTGKNSLYELLDRQSGAVRINLIFSYKGYEDMVFTYRKTYKFLVQGQLEKWRKAMGLPNKHVKEVLLIVPEKKKAPAAKKKPEPLDDWGRDSEGEIRNMDTYLKQINYLFGSYDLDKEPAKEELNEDSENSLAI